MKMTSVVNFILESGISLAFLSLIYILFLRRETFFRLNRFYLLGSLLFSVVLPFLRLRVYEPQPVMLSEITVTPHKNLMQAVTVYGQDFSGSLEKAVLSSDLFIWIYLGGLIFYLGRFMVRSLQIAWLIRKNPVHRFDGLKLVFLEQESSPFSFLRYLFVSQSLQSKEGYDRMMAHEMEHIRQGHSVDVIMLEILTVFQWFNPFMWMLRRAIRENHEFLADQAVLAAGVSRGYYKKLLLNQFAGGPLLLTNNFNYSLIKNRIKMMSKIKSSRMANVKYAFGLISIAALIIAFACEQKETIVPGQPENENVLTLKHTILKDGRIKLEGTEEDLEKFRNRFSGETEFQIITDSLGGVYLVEQEKVKPKSLEGDQKVFFIVEEMPEYPGGEMALRKFISQNINYPETAQKQGTQGKVYVTFVVSKDGTVANAKIARGVDPVIDKEALRVVNSLPKWKPGKQKGKNVNVSYTVPINFVLQGGEENKPANNEKNEINTTIFTKKDNS